MTFFFAQQKKVVISKVLQQQLWLPWLPVSASFGRHLCKKSKSVISSSLKTRRTSFSSPYNDPDHDKDQQQARLATTRQSKKITSRKHIRLAGPPMKGKLPLLASFQGHALVALFFSRTLALLQLLLLLGILDTRQLTLVSTLERAEHNNNGSGSTTRTDRGGRHRGTAAQCRSSGGPVHHTKSTLERHQKESSRLTWTDPMRLRQENFLEVKARSSATSVGDT